MLRKIRNLAFVLIVLSAVLAMPLVADVQAQGQGPSGDQVYGLGGSVQMAAGHLFGHFFAADDGVTYGLLGATPEVELQLDTVARDLPSTNIKIWGRRMPDTDGYPTILVTDVLAPNQVTPTAAPTATPTPQPVTVVVKQNPVYLRTGPHLNFPWYIVVPPGTACTAYVRNAAASWLQVACTTGGSGWLWTEMVYINGDINLLPVLDVPTPPPPTPTPIPPTATPRPTATSRPPTPTPQPPTNQWRARYYNNIYLSGNPTGDRIEQRGEHYPLQKTFHGSPAPGVASTNWSARYEGRFWFGGGDYTFHALVGGGVRVYLDDHLVLSEWEGGDHGLQNTFLGVGAGEHRVRVEYFTHGGQGWLNVWWIYNDGRGRDE